MCAPSATAAAFAAAIDVPLLLAYGDGDLTRNFTGAFARYERASDATLFVLHDSAHCHNQAATRAELWDRMDRWIRSEERTSRSLSTT